MAKSKLNYKETGRFAHVEMGEYDGNNYALDGDFPVCQLPNKEYIITLGWVALPPMERDSPDRAAISKRRKQANA